MSSTTPNLALTLYDSTTDQVVTFATFRAVWGGPASTSNFYKIDTAWGLLDGRIDVLEAYRGAIPTPSTFISANYYEATVAAITAYTSGMNIVLSVDTTSDGTVTLNINALGTKSVMKVDSTGAAINLTGSDLVDGRQYLFTYDGTRWLWVSANSADQIQIVGTAGNVVTVGSTNNLVGTVTQSVLMSGTTHAATAKSPVADADEFSIADSAASYVLKMVTLAVLKLAVYLGIKPPDGTVWNGRILPSVTSNNLTLALKTFAGTDPSATDPVYVTIGGTVRTITAALSVVTNAATNWSNAGGAELATKEHDRFAYLGYNATDGVVIGHSRIPYANLYSDFSATSTNEKYCAISTIANAAAGDNYVNIGRFAATLSAGAGYTWTVPTFTSANLIQRPIFETRKLTWTSVFTGFSANPTVSLSYIVRQNQLYADSVVTGHGASNQTYFTQTIPFASLISGINILAQPYDNSGFVAAGLLTSSAGSNVLTFYKSQTSAWTNSGNKSATFNGWFWL